MSAIELGLPDAGMHPLHGIHEPTTSTPARCPGSIRRTTSIDMTRDAGSLDPVYLSGRARDLMTTHDGMAVEIGQASMRVAVEKLTRVVRQIDVEPVVAGMDLVGAPAMGGFRAAVDKAAPELSEHRDLRYALLDDVPVATLISGHALSASGALGNGATSGYLPVADQCAGFVTGGLLMTSFESGVPAVVTGPPAPRLEDPDDPLAWHDMSALPVHGMRRRRRLDVKRNGASEMEIDAMFRDTYVRADGTETIIHEYTVTAVVESDTQTIVSAQAVARVLPWQECPGAVASATRLIGMRLDQLNHRVRREFRGTSTCTHLNDLLRGVADAAALYGLLPAS